MDEEIFVTEELDFPEKNKRRAIRRKKDIAKAKRKRDININTTGDEWYNNLHQYSKNKVHCSCMLCRFRNIFNPNAKTHSDMMREATYNTRLKEYAREVV